MFAHYSATTCTIQKNKFMPTIWNPFIMNCNAKFAITFNYCIAYILWSFSSTVLSGVG